MSIKGRGQNGSTHFRKGEVVAVRSLDEILATLDADAKLDGLPFMPEMAPYCGKSFRVFRRAEKTCVEGIGIRSMKNTVFLEGLRCDGSAHQGCQRGCLFFWNEAWLKAEGGRRKAEGGRRKAENKVASGQRLVASEEEVRNANCKLSESDQKSEIINHKSSNPQSPIPNLSVQQLPLPTTKGDCFFCQSTELAGATGEFAPGKLRHYLHDLRVGEMSLKRFAYILWLALTNRAWRLLYGRGFYQLTGEQTKTLRVELNLQPGELVEIKSPAEIEATLDAKGRNRGLSFEPEMAQHCGRRYRVATQVRTIIAEENGKMVQLGNTVILDGLVCKGICAMNCPRANYFYWREIWLKRV